MSDDSNNLLKASFDLNSFETRNNLNLKPPTMILGKKYLQFRSNSAEHSSNLIVKSLDIADNEAKDYKTKARSTRSYSFDPSASSKIQLKLPTYKYLNDIFR